MLLTLRRGRLTTQLKSQHLRWEDTKVPYSQMGLHPMGSQANNLKPCMGRKQAKTPKLTTPVTSNLAGHWASLR